MPLHVHDQDLARAQAALARRSRRPRWAPRRLPRRPPRAPDAVTVTDSGRRPLRSSIAPTRVPSLKHSAAGPSHGCHEPGRASCAAHPARARRPCAGPARRGWPPAGPHPDASPTRPAAGAPRRGTANPRRARRAAGPSAASRSPMRPPSLARRPRTCSRLPRTVLISPLWARTRNGCASAPRGMGIGGVALMEHGVADGQVAVSRSGYRAPRRSPATRPL